MGSGSGPWVESFVPRSPSRQFLPWGLFSDTAAPVTQGLLSHRTKLFYLAIGSFSRDWSDVGSLRPAFMAHKVADILFTMGRYEGSSAADGPSELCPSPSPLTLQALYTVGSRSQQELRARRGFCWRQARTLLRPWAGPAGDSDPLY